MISFVLGVLSSLAASLIYLGLSRAPLRWWRSYPRGVRFVEPGRDVYLHQIADLIRSNKTRLFFKGFTGFDLFSSDIIKTAFDQTRTDSWNELVFVLTDPNGDAFDSEVNPFYARQHLTDLQRTVREYLEHRLLPNIRVEPGGLCGLFSVAERKNLVNLLILDSQAFLFFRGFTKRRGPGGQVIVNVNLTRCPDMVRELVLFAREHYLHEAGVLSASAKATRIGGDDSLFDS